MQHFCPVEQQPTPAHGTAHTHDPFVHVMLLAHEMPHEPQCAGSLINETSHPSPAAPLQFA